VERGHGAFRRSFTLPATVDGTRINATYTDGVLTITLPRREETRPRQIPIGG
jgi:HSP20 family protein